MIYRRNKKGWFEMYNSDRAMLTYAKSVDEATDKFFATFGTTPVTIIRTNKLDKNRIYLLKN